MRWKAVFKRKRTIFLKSNIAGEGFFTWFSGCGFASEFLHAAGGIFLIDSPAAVFAVFYAVVCFLCQSAAYDTAGIAVAMPASDVIIGFLVISEVVFQRPAQIADIQMVFR